MMITNLTQEKTKGSKLEINNSFHPDSENEKVLKLSLSEFLKMKEFKNKGYIIYGEKGE